MEVLQKRSNSNGHTLGFNPQTQMLESPQCLITGFGSEKVKHWAVDGGSYGWEGKLLRKVFRVPSNRNR